MWESKLEELQKKHKKEKESHRKALKEAKQQQGDLQDHMEEQVAMLHTEHKEVLAGLMEELKMLSTYRQEVKQLKEPPVMSFLLLCLL